MKTTLIIIIFFCLSLKLTAQEYDKNNNFSSGFEITVGYGVTPFLSDISESYYYLAGYDPGQVLDMYKQRIINTGYINTGITYRTTKRLELSMALSYTSSTKRYSHKTELSRYGYKTDHSFAVIPEVRFVWFNSNSDRIKLYSSFGAGALIINKTNFLNPVNNRFTLKTLGKITPIGVKVGRGNVYGLGEISIVTTGGSVSGMDYH